MKKICTSVLLTFIAYLSAVGQFYNGSEQTFGKNRVQYQEFFWQYYRYNRFDTYFYKGGEELAEYVGEKATLLIPAMEKKFEFVFDDKLQIIVYKSFSDFKQSNVGLANNESTNIGGTTRFIDNKLFVYFEGTHQGLDQQVSTGISQVIVEQLLYGGSLRDVFSSSAFLSLPEWYVPGLIKHMGVEWNLETDNLTRDAVLNNEFEKIHHLQGNKAELAGHALWNYIGEVYGNKVIPSILYMTRATKNIETGFIYVLGLDLASLMEEFNAFYKKRYEEDNRYREEADLEELSIKTKKNRVYTQFKLSPDGFRAAYVSNILGQYRIFVYDIENSERKKVVKGSHKMKRITDYSYPIITWHPSNDILAYIIEKKGRVFLNLYSTSEKENTSRELFGLDKVQSLSFSPDGKTMLFSASAGGQTDIYRYFITGNRYEKLTDDLFDELYPTFIDNGKKIVYTSNKPDTTYAEYGSFYGSQFDIFESTLKEGGLSQTKRITTTENINETHPQDYGNLKYTYLADESGIINRFSSKYDSTILSVDTTLNYHYFNRRSPLSNYNRNILDYSLQTACGMYTMLMYKDGKNHFYMGKIDDDEEVSFSELKKASLKSIKRINFISLDTSTIVNPRPLKNQITAAGNKTTVKRAFKVADDETKSEVNIKNYRFQDEEGLESKKDTLSKNSKLSLLIKGVKKKRPEKRNYRLNYTSDEATVLQVDNQYVSGFYQRLAGPGATQPGLSGMFTMGATDLFEDYRIAGGFRLGVSFQNSDYFISYSDLSKRTDVQTSLYRGAQNFVANIPQLGRAAIFKVTTYSAARTYKYPFSEVSAVSISPAIRYDQIVVKSIDAATLNIPTGDEYQGGLKLDYVYDNTLSRGLNLRTGLRMKAFIEGYTQINEKKSDTYVAGIDARHYTQVHRSIIWANRFALGVSAGNRQVLFYLGGVNRWFYLPEIDQNSSMPNLDKFYYQSTITPMRGFNRDARRGNKFLVYNTEMRVPVFKYLSGKPLKSEFLETFQLTFFGDAGTAWQGTTPFSPDNESNFKEFQSGPITVRIKNNANPFIFGYGFGLHAKLLGYFVRADWAWGYDNGKERDRQFYISLSLDF